MLLLLLLGLILISEGHGHGSLTSRIELGREFSLALKKFLKEPANVQHTLSTSRQAAQIALIMDRAERYKNYVKYRDTVDRVNGDPALPFTTEINSFSVERHLDQFRGLNETHVEGDMMFDYEVEEEGLRGRWNGVGEGKGRYLNTVKAGDISELPEQVDWRHTLSPPPHQGRCGSCWAFSAIATVESAFYRATGIKRKLSEQAVLDCSLEKYPDLDGCKGTLITAGLLWTALNLHIPQLSDYPYIGKDLPCTAFTAPNSLRNVKLRRFTRVQKDDVSLMTSSATGVLSVGIHAGYSLMAYRSGVYYDPRTCDSNSFPNHAVNLVGYGGGTDGGLKYWILRNSYGSSWGEEGYFRMSRDHDNTCHINLTAIKIDFKCVDKEECERNLENN